MAKTKISRSSIKKYSKNKKYFSKGGSRSSRSSRDSRGVSGVSGGVVINKLPSVRHFLDPVPDTPLFDPELSKLTDECNKKNTLIDEINLEILKKETKLAETKKLLKDAKVAQKISCDALNNKRKEINMKSAFSATGIFVESSAPHVPTTRLS